MTARPAYGPLRVRLLDVIAPSFSGKAVILSDARPGLRLRRLRVWAGGFSIEWKGDP